eukprot:jgi/Mesvir1/14457/Mv11504-RA.1
MADDRDDAFLNEGRTPECRGGRTRMSLRGHNISHRLVMLRARLVLLLVISAVIMLTAALTWIISLKTTGESFDGMSSQLRDDVAAGAVSALKNSLNQMSLAINTLYLSLDGLMLDYARDTLSGPALAAMWSVFNVYNDTTTVGLFSAQDIMAGYRRNGPEGAVLRSPIAVGIPAPEDDNVTLVMAFLPDPVTGAPQLHGPRLGLCYIERCPRPLNTSLYLGPGESPVNSFIYKQAQGLPRRMLLWNAQPGTLASGLQPDLFVAGALKDRSGATAAVIYVTTTTYRLQAMVSSTAPVQRYSGRMFITLSHQLSIITASNGSLFLPPLEPGGLPRFMPATNSSDRMIREAAIFMNETYGDMVFCKPLSTMMHMPGGAHYYINTNPYHHEGMLLVVFLVIPYKQLSGEINDLRKGGILITFVVALAMLVAGGLAMCLSTIALSRVLATQGSSLHKVAAANQALTQQLAALNADGSIVPDVDMATPLEELTAAINGLQPGQLLTPVQRHHLMRLITSDDLHRPYFLDTVDAVADASSEGAPEAQVSMDRETGTWIKIFAMGRRAAGRISSSVGNNTQSPGWFATRRVRHILSQLQQQGPPAMLPERLAPRQYPEDSINIHGPESPWGKQPREGPPGGPENGKDAPPLLPARDARAIASPSHYPRQGDHPGEVLKLGAVSPSHEHPTFVDIGDLSHKKVKRSLSIRSMRWNPQHQTLARLNSGSMRTLLALVAAATGPTASGVPDNVHATNGGVDATSTGVDATDGGMDPITDLGADSGSGLGADSGAALLAASRADRRAFLFRDLSNAPSMLGEGAITNCPVRTDAADGRAVSASRESDAYVSPPRRDKPYQCSTQLVGCDESEALRHQAVCLRGIGAWDFDTLALAAAAEDALVPLVGLVLFTKTGLLSEFGLCKYKLANFLCHVAGGMRPQPYHNSAHICDVAASVAHLLMDSGVSDHLRPIDRLAALCAALVHDYKHPGVNNDFLNRMRHDLATVYNDESPLENYHLSEAFYLLYTNKHCNFLEVLSEADFMELRRVVIDMVLATEMKKHFAVVDQFKTRLLQGAQWDVNKDSDRTLLLQLVLKVADIGHSAKPLAVHVEWSRRVNEEFYKQGDAERLARLEVSPFMDRFKNNVPKSQLGFFHFLVVPLFESWVKAFPRSAHLLASIEANMEYWKRELHAMEA